MRSPFSDQRFQLKIMNLCISLRTWTFTYTKSINTSWKPKSCLLFHHLFMMQQNLSYKCSTEYEVWSTKISNQKWKGTIKKGKLHFRLNLWNDYDGKTLYFLYYNSIKCQRNEPLVAFICWTFAKFMATNILV